MEREIYETVKNQPLSGRTAGVELNLLRLLFIDKMRTVSGSISLFDINRSAEWAFPWFYHDHKNNRLNSLTLDCQYRRFLGHQQNGFYLSFFSRFSRLWGDLDDDRFYFVDAADYMNATQNKLGIGIGTGHRKFSYRGLYWGISFNVGRFLLGESDRMDGDTDLIIDMELLKFGWAF